MERRLKIFSLTIIYVPYDAGEKILRSKGTLDYRISREKSTDATRRVVSRRIASHERARARARARSIEKKEKKGINGAIDCG